MVVPTKILLTTKATMGRRDMRDMKDTRVVGMIRTDMMVTVTMDTDTMQGATRKNLVPQVPQMPQVPQVPQLL